MAQSEQTTESSVEVKDKSVQKNTVYHRTQPTRRPSGKKIRASESRRGLLQIYVWWGKGKAKMQEKKGDTVPVARGRSGFNLRTGNCNSKSAGEVKTLEHSTDPVAVLQISPNGDQKEKNRGHVFSF